MLENDEIMKYLKAAKKKNSIEAWKSIGNRAIPKKFWPSGPPVTQSRVRSVIICWIFCPSAPQSPDLLTAKTEEDLVKNSIANFDNCSWDFHYSVCGGYSLDTFQLWKNTCKPWTCFAVDICTICSRLFTHLVWPMPVHMRNTRNLAGPLVLPDVKPCLEL